MATIVVLPEVYDALHELVKVLHQNGYFGFEDSAIAYVDAIYDFIYTIPGQPKRLTLQNKFGRFYCRFSPNKHTSYYIIFDCENDIYLIRHILNNHGPDYPKLIPRRDH
jgi:hypothetical protein